VRDRADVADEVARLGQQFDHDGSGAVRRLAGEAGVGVAGGLGGQPRAGPRAEATVATDDGAGRQVELAPPRDVGGVAERADHRDAGALLGIGEMVGDDRDLDAEHRRVTVVPNSGW
jgi:hypothetical protein